MPKIKILVSMLISFFAPVFGYLLNGNSNYLFLEFRGWTSTLITINIIFSSVSYFLLKITGGYPDISIPRKDSFFQLLYTLLPLAVLMEIGLFFN